MKLIPLNIENVFKEENRLDNFCCQGILLFLLFLDTFRIQGVLLFLHFLDTFGSGPLRAEKREKFTRGNFTLPLGTLLDPLGTLLDLLGTLLDPLGTLLDPLGTLLQYTGPYWTLLQYTGPVGYSTGTCCHLNIARGTTDPGYDKKSDEGSN